MVAQQQINHLLSLANGLLIEAKASLEIDPENEDMKWCVEHIEMSIDRLEMQIVAVQPKDYAA